MFILSGCQACASGHRQEQVARGVHVHAVHRQTDRSLLLVMSHAAKGTCNECAQIHGLVAWKNAHAGVKPSTPRKPGGFGHMAVMSCNRLLRSEICCVNMFPALSCWNPRHCHDFMKPWIHEHCCRLRPIVLHPHVVTQESPSEIWSMKLANQNGTEAVLSRANRVMCGLRHYHCGANSECQAS